MLNVEQIPLARLVHGGAFNSRKLAATYDDLVRSIESHGLLTPLIVVESDKPDVYRVIAGNRRLQALTALVKKGNGKAAAWDKVPCIISTDKNPLEVSMIENVYRKALHPVDKFEVFTTLALSQSLEQIAAAHGMKLAELRQILALATMAPEIRQAWRDGHISAETAEAFTITRDIAAQARTFKKFGKGRIDAFQVNRALRGADRPSIASALKFVGHEAYEAAGHFVNASLFSGDKDAETVVSDAAALYEMADKKLSEKCDSLTKSGWGWALLESEAPKDLRAWRRVTLDIANLTKEQKAGLGCTVKLGWEGRVDITYGYAKPGAKLPIPKKAKAKKAGKGGAAKAEEVASISGALAQRLAKQMTAGLRIAFRDRMYPQFIMPIVTACLMSKSKGFHDLKLGKWDSDIEEARDRNDFASWFYGDDGNEKRIEPPADMHPQLRRLTSAIALSLNLYANNEDELRSLLNPKGKNDDYSLQIIAKCIEPTGFDEAMQAQFDADDYAASVPIRALLDAIEEIDGIEAMKSVEKRKKGQLAKHAAERMRATKWTPDFMRLPGMKPLPAIERIIPSAPAPVAKKEKPLAGGKAAARLRKARGKK